jgi:2,5-diketo-D-gluconate reductase A
MHMADGVLDGLSLAHGAQMPRIGLGTWPMDDAEAERVIADAITAGYRLVDTAENYGNERGVGAGVRASGIARGDLFLTSKFNREWHSVAGVAEAFERSAERLGVDYIDLFLIHWPNADQDRYVEAWEGLVALLEAGSVRSIGTSNFKPAHLKRIIHATSVPPDVNQVQLNPRVAQRATVEFDSFHGIVTQSWSPIGQGNDLLESSEVVAGAAREGCTPAQVVIAWHLAKGLSAVPKSSNPDRLRANLAASSITLQAETVAALDSMDGQEGSPLDSDVFGH